MSGQAWRAEVMRLNPATDTLVVKVRHQINASQAADIKARIAAVMPEIRTLIVGEDFCDLVVVRKTRRKTLVTAGRQR